jgi:hypothetical protein
MLTTHKTDKSMSQTDRWKETNQGENSGEDDEDMHAA